MILHIDPAIGSFNLGDEIISKSIDDELRSIFPSERIIRISSRDFGAQSEQLITKADYVFFGGSNALSSNPIFGYRQFSVGRFGLFKFKKKLDQLVALRPRKIILMGVGWWQYQENITMLSTLLYKKILRSDCLHSVRDDYTKNKLNEIGITNVENTGCPTLWKLESFDAPINDVAVITLTDYNQNIKRDKAFLRKVCDIFSTVKIWPQGVGDLDYLNCVIDESKNQKIIKLRPNLESLAQALSDGSTYIGTRLHAGIMALQLKAPSYIIPIDNRAAEMSGCESLVLTNPDLSDVLTSSRFNYIANKNPAVDLFKGRFRR